MNCCMRGWKDSENLENARVFVEANVFCRRENQKKQNQRAPLDLQPPAYSFYYDNNQTLSNCQ